MDERRGKLIMKEINEEWKERGGGRPQESMNDKRKALIKATQWKKRIKRKITKWTEGWAVIKQQGAKDHKRRQRAAARGGGSLWWKPCCDSLVISGHFPLAWSTTTLTTYYELSDMFKKNATSSDVKKSLNKCLDAKRDTPTRLRHLRTVLGENSNRLF